MANHPNSLHAPVTLATLPPELWEQIFEYTLPESSTNGPFISPSHKQSPLLLTQICKQWRQAASSLPRLWSDLAVTIYRSGSFPPNELVHLWLSRSRQLPLCISVRLQRHPGPNVYEYIESAFSGVIPYATRWELLDIRLGPFLEMDTLLRVQNAPVLKGLSLMLPGTFAQMSAPLEEFIRRAPQLRQLTLSADFPEQDLPNFRFPFNASKITKLYLQSSMFSMDNCVELLEQTPNLEDFIYHDMWGRFHRIPDQADGQPLLITSNGPRYIAHHSLRRVELRTTSHRTSSFFDKFIFPALDTLAITCHYPLDINHLTDLLERSSCKLLALTLHLPNLSSEADLIRCMKAVERTVRILDLDIKDIFDPHGIISNAFFELLAPSDIELPVPWDFMNEVPLEFDSNEQVAHFCLSPPLSLSTYPLPLPLPPPIIGFPNLEHILLDRCRASIQHLARFIVLRLLLPQFYAPSSVVLPTRIKSMKLVSTFRSPEIDLIINFNLQRFFEVGGYFEEARPAEPWVGEAETLEGSIPLGSSELIFGDVMSGIYVVRYEEGETWRNHLRVGYTP